MEQKDVKNPDCPYCGGKMTWGFVASSRFLWWTENEPGLLITKGSRNIQLDSKLVGLAKLRARRCDTCKVIIIRR